MRLPLILETLIASYGHLSPILLKWGPELKVHRLAVCKRCSGTTHREGGVSLRFLEIDNYTFKVGWIFLDEIGFSVKSTLQGISLNLLLWKRNDLSAIM